MRLMLLVTLAALAGGTAAMAQSLGAVARAEGERRQHAAPGKVYSESTMRRERKAPPDAPAEPAAAAAAVTPPVADIMPAAAVADGKRAEAQWRARARELRSTLSDARGRVEALYGRLRELDAQIQSTHSAPLSRERAVTSTSVEKAERDVRFLEDELQRFEKVAKAERVPEDWIR